MKRLMTIGMLAVAVLCAGASEAIPVKSFKPYPFDTCLVGGEKLGNMGMPFVFKYKDQVIKFCCKGCLDDFKKSPKKFLDKLTVASKASDPSSLPEPKP